ncbi:hypothetical protein [Longimicrobium sp.]|uniref:hypothetical protein n=1 Tax=Longimicrobium sp. TaxID=2029185 RepID=UPI003B3B175C
MLTLVLQNVSTLLIAVCAIASLLVYGAARAQAPVEHRGMWLLTGTALGTLALVKGIHGALGIWAYAAGPKTAIWANYMAWTPAFNHSRTLLLLAYCIILAHFSVRPVPFSRRYYRGALAAMAVAFLMGAGLGAMEPRYTALTHFTAVAQWDVVELLVLLGTLMAALLGGRMDRVLWSLLCVYAMSLAFNVLWFAASSRADIAGQWVPRPWVLQAVRTALYAGMALLALYRLRQARGGRSVPPLAPGSGGYRTSLSG